MNIRRLAGGLLMAATVAALTAISGQPAHAAAGHLQIVDFGSGKCMDVRDAINADGTVVQQWACTGTPSMRWGLNPDSFSGVHQIISQIGRRCLDVRGGSVLNNAQIQVYRCTGFGNGAQVWSFNAVP